eukprot:239152-Pelagomonas_calceolata.AAC.1
MSIVQATDFLTPGVEACPRSEGRRTDLLTTQYPLATDFLVPGVGACPRSEGRRASVLIITGAQCAKGARDRPSGCPDRHQSFNSS